jgi:hypothetical protein
MLLASLGEIAHTVAIVDRAIDVGVNPSAGVTNAGVFLTQVGILCASRTPSVL